MKKRTIRCMGCGKHNIEFTTEAPKKCPGCGAYNLPCVGCKIDACNMETYETVCPYTKKK